MVWMWEVRAVVYLERREGGEGLMSSIVSIGL